jgi:GNAT superfamily N-acetyltransferase
MFADAALAARIDRAEGRLCSRLATSSSGHRAAFVLPINGGVAVFAGPHSPINKVIGVGFDGPLDPAGMDTIEERWAAQGEPVRVELSILADPAVVAILAGRGYRLQGFENVLATRIPDAPPSPAPDIAVETVAAGGYEQWLSLAVDAFANMDGSGSASDPVLPREDLERLLREAMGPTTAEGVTRYIARLDGQPAGEAALNVEDGLALLAGSGTAPQYRGRGVQKALIAHRLHEAHRAGCDLAVVVTAPGTRSQENVMRRGFDLLYTRAILVRPI